MDEPLVETEVADSEPPRRSGPWKLISAVVVLTLVGIWLVPGESPDEEPTELAERPTPDAKPPSLLDRASAGPTQRLQTGSTSATDEERSGQPGVRAREMIAGLRSQGTVDLAAVHAAAVDAQARGEMTDAYLLYFFAAREGHAASALTLAMQADPASRDPADSVFEDADLNQAHKWYEMAARSGDARGQERLSDLRSRVDRLAASGDPQARRLSLRWQ